MVPEAELKERKGLAYVLNVDGFGTQPLKIAKYKDFVAPGQALPARLQALLLRGRGHDDPGAGHAPAAAARRRRLRVSPRWVTVTRSARPLDRPRRRRGRPDRGRWPARAPPSARPDAATRCLELAELERERERDGASRGGRGAGADRARAARRRRPRAERDRDPGRRRRGRAGQRPGARAPAAARDPRARPRRRWARCGGCSGALREDGAGAELAPQPGLAQLPGAGRARPRGRDAGHAARRGHAAPAARRPRPVGVPDRAGGADERPQARRRGAGERARGVAPRPARLAGARHGHRARRRESTATATASSGSASGCELHGGELRAGALPGGGFEVTPAALARSPRASFETAVSVD